VGTLSRQPAPRIATHDDRPAPTHDAVLLGTTSFCGDAVYDVGGRFLGEIEELIVDLPSGRVAYALMAAGGFLGIGRKLFAIPWGAIAVDRDYQRCVINSDLERLIDAPGLDGDPLPRMADLGWAMELHVYFGCKPYWD
jgi:hypothetical protein